MRGTFDNEIKGALAAGKKPFTKGKKNGSLGKFVTSKAAGSGKDESGIPGGAGSGSMGEPALSPKYQGGTKMNKNPVETGKVPAGRRAGVK